MKEKIFKSGAISIAGALFSIVPVMGYYPFVAAYGVALMCSYCIRWTGILAMLTSIFLFLDVMSAVKYSLILLAIATVIHLLEEKNSRMKSMGGAFIGAITVLLMESTDLLMGNIHKEELIIISGLVLLTISGGLLFHRFIELFLTAGEKLPTNSKEKTKQMEQFLFYEERLKTIGDSFIKLAKCSDISLCDSESSGGVGIENKIISEQKKESRKLLSMYLKETGNIIKGLSEGTNKLVKTDREKEENIVKELSELNIQCMDVRIIEDKGKKRIALKMRKKGKSYVTVANVSKVISRIMNKKYVSAGDKKFLENQMSTFIFNEDTNYFVLHGMAKKSIDQNSSGDNFTCVNLEGGQTLLSISDGMGTGNKANRESGQVVELIEDFMECGYSEELALKLINSMFVTKGDMCPATVDMSIIDMHSGVCDILKSGAATTYVKRDGWVEAIKSTSLPIGVMDCVDMESTKKKLYDGDFVIMMSDGLMEAIEEEEKDEVISNIIMSAKAKKPKDLAWEILNTVCEKTGSIINDDMTVLVTGIWDKFA